MLVLIITIACIILSGICKAISDTLKSERWDTSVFSGLNPYFWNPIVSWLNKYKGRVYANGRKYPKFLDGFTDAWHIFNNSSNYLLLVPICLTPTLFVGNTILLIAIKFVVALTLHMQTFNLFYSHILIKKKQ